MKLVRGLRAGNFRDGLHDGGASVLVGLIVRSISRRRLATFGERGRGHAATAVGANPLGSALNRGILLPRILAARQDAIPAAANLAAASDRSSQTQDPPCTLGACGSRTGRLAGVRTGRVSSP